MEISQKTFGMVIGLLVLIGMSSAVISQILSYASSMSITTFSGTGVETLFSVGVFGLILGFAVFKLIYIYITKIK